MNTDSLQLIEILHKNKTLNEENQWIKKCFFFYFKLIWIDEHEFNVTCYSYNRLSSTNSAGVKVVGWSR